MKNILGHAVIRTDTMVPKWVCSYQRITKGGVKRLLICYTHSLLHLTHDDSAKQSGNLVRITESLLWYCRSGTCWYMAIRKSINWSQVAHYVVYIWAGKKSDDSKLVHNPTKLAGNNHMEKHTTLVSLLATFFTENKKQQANTRKYLLTCWVTIGNVCLVVDFALLARSRCRCAVIYIKLARSARCSYLLLLRLSETPKGVWPFVYS